MNFRHLEREMRMNFGNTLVGLFWLACLITVLVTIIMAPSSRHERRMKTIVPCESNVIRYTEGGMWCVNEIRLEDGRLEYQPIHATCQEDLDNTKALCKPLDK